MGRTLRICLAMGGGVSLGSFSGSGLTESVKLLLLYGRDKSGHPYDNIIVDGMSGASAGAIALTIMLKCLIDYKSMLILCGNNISEDDLQAEIAHTYFGGDRDALINHRQYKSLIALQVAQKIQYEIWVNEVNSVDLFGKNIENSKPEPDAAFALLQRELLETLTRKFLMQTEEIDLSNKALLDNTRVIFACSLTNLLPIELNFGPKKIQQLEQNVLKSTGSQSHAELRVIDFVFDEDRINRNRKASDHRWLKFCANPDSEKENQFNFKEKKAWAVISASALACGAFPVAFEPVLLKRFKEEFGGDKDYSLWPEALKNLENEIYGLDKDSFIGVKDLSNLDYKSFNFPYMDGGTFNNEPIREAFKIGTFQDFDRDTSNEERIVLFVDPIVRAEQYHSFRVPAFSALKHKEDNTVKEQGEFSKLVAGISGIIGVLKNEGSVKEEHKIIDVKENLALRETIFEYLDNNKDIGENLKVSLLSTAFNKISKNLTSDILSLGTRDPIIYFLAYFKKNCRNHELYPILCQKITRDALESVQKEIGDGELDINVVYQILEIDSDGDRPSQNLFASTVFKLIIDFALNTAGKSEDAQRVAILPISNDLFTIRLPGEEVSAFAGFASSKSRKYAFEYGRLSALLALREEEKGFRKEPFISDENLGEIERIIKKDIEDTSLNTNEFSQDLKKNLFTPAITRITKVLITNRFLKMMLLKVPLLLGSIFSSLYMMTQIFRMPWRGKGFVDRIIYENTEKVKFRYLEPLTCSILSKNKIDNKVIVHCRKEGNKKIQGLRILKDLNHGERYYQYLFPLYLLEYSGAGQSSSPEGKDQKLNSQKINPLFVEEIALSLSRKIRLPDHIDANLNPQQNRNAFEANFENIVKEIRIGKNHLPLLDEAINNKNSSLFYSLKNINLHVNPLLEIDLRKPEPQWYFLEKTEALSTKLLRDEINDGQ